MRLGGGTVVAGRVFNVGVNNGDSFEYDLSTAQDIDGERPSGDFGDFKMVAYSEPSSGPCVC